MMTASQTGIIDVLLNAIMTTITIAQPTACAMGIENSFMTPSLEIQDKSIIIYFFCQIKYQTAVLAVFVLVVKNKTLTKL